MTGWAQVNGYRGDTSIRKRIEHDLDSFTERREDGSHGAEIEAEVVRKRQGDRRSLAAAGESRNQENPDHEPVGYLRRPG